MRLGPKPRTHIFPSKSPSSFPSHSVPEKRREVRSPFAFAIINFFSKMPSPFSVFRKKSTSRPFKDFFAEPFDTLLPHLRQSPSPRNRPPSSLTALTSSSKLRHLLSYYDALDLAASNDVSQFLFPSSLRNPIEIPFLFPGDILPYIFTNLLRSFIEEANNYEDDAIDGFLPWDRHQIAKNLEYLDKSWQFLVAWKNPSNILIARIDQIERGLKVMVPDLVYRIRKEQKAAVGKIANHWVSCEGKKMDIEEAVKEEMEEMMAVFLAANRLRSLRRSVITEIVGATNVYQGALFFEALSQFLVGFRDTILLGEFPRCNMPILRLR